MKKLSQLLLLSLLFATSSAIAATVQDQLTTIAIDDIDKTKSLKAPTIALGKKIYQANCASCHGANLKGNLALHSPDLSDKAVLYSSDNVDADIDQMFASDFETTIKYGIRADHPMTRKMAFMPSFAGLVAKQEGGYPTLPDKDIADLTEFVVSIRGDKTDKDSALRGKKLFAVGGGCYDCHSDDGKGNGSIGATDFSAKKYFLFGSDRTAITASIREGRHNTMPAYENKLSPAEIKAVSYYLFTVQKNAKALQAQK